MLLLVTHGKLNTLAVSGAAVFWGLTSAAALAFYSLYPAGLLKKYPAALLTGWAMFTGGAVLALRHPPWQASGIWDWQSVLAMGFIVIFGTLVPFQFYLLAVRKIGGQTTSLLLSAEPLSAALASVVWLRVPFGPLDWLGAVCVSSTVFLLAMRKTAAPQAHPG
jgi:drug/metabolite transporter (DMT)-like permease